MTRYRWVDSRKAEGFPVTEACAAAGVSTSAFYAWAATGRDGPTEGELAQAYLVNAIIEAHRGSGGTYGVPRMTAELRDAGWSMASRPTRKNSWRPKTSASPRPTQPGPPSASANWQSQVPWWRFRPSLD